MSRRFFFLLAACLGLGAPAAIQAAEGLSEDVIARVGDQTITLRQIDTMINSSPIQGMPAPPVGTPERNTVRLTVLDKVVTANLFYLDARRQGLDRDPAYREAMARFSDGMLVAIYRQKYLRQDLQVTPDEVQAYYESAVQQGTELTDDVKAAIEAKLRSDKSRVGAAARRSQLREGIRVELVEAELDPSEDPIREDEAVVATLDGAPITWGEVKGVLSTPTHTLSADRRRGIVNEFIDSRIMIRKARELGLEKDPAYRARVGEFRKTRLITAYRARLIQSIQPTDAVLREYFEKNRDRIAVKEQRKVQMVVLRTREEAEAVHKRIADGEMTIYEAAQQHSIDPNAKSTLGEIGWVLQGSGFPALDELTFSLAPGEIGGPVQSPAGWHLVRVLDLRDARYQDMDDPATRDYVRSFYINDRMGQHAIDLRRNAFTVEVYQEVLKRIFENEAAAANAAGAEARSSAAVT